MEPHSDQKGRLKGKFEDFGHVPSSDVWERISAEPSDRPLGAKFWGFSWMPKQRVWRRIGATLHPVPYRRIAAISMAAAAALALLVYIGIGAGPGQAGVGTTTGTHPILVDAGNQVLPEREASLLEVPCQRGAAEAQLALDNADALSNHFAGSSLHQGHRPQAISAREGDHPEIGPDPAPAFPLFMISAQAAPSLAADIRSIDYRNNFNAALALEIAAEKDAQISAQVQADIEAYESEHRKADNRSLMAQAGTNLAPGSLALANTYELDALGLDQGVGLSNFSLESTEATLDETFRTPLTFGMGMDKLLRKGFSVGLGIVYTHLTSYVEAADANMSQRLDISRQYLGLNTSARYRLPVLRDSKRVGLYVNAGLQYDFGLGKRTEFSSYALNAPAVNTSVKAQLPGQANFNTGLGLQARVYGPLYAYGQAGMAHYFYHPETNLFSEKALWPSLQLGLRLGL